MLTEPDDFYFCKLCIESFNFIPHTPDNDYDTTSHHFTKIIFS